MFLLSCIQLINIQAVGSRAILQLSLLLQMRFYQMHLLLKKDSKAAFCFPLHSQRVLAHCGMCFGSCTSFVDSEADNPLECHPDNRRQKE
jgi:hypothetical protein